MTLSRLILQTLRHFWKQNLAVALGVAISTAVITGALIVGDSVQYSLLKIVELRLGGTTHTVSAGDRYFTDSLAARLEEEISRPVAPLLLLEGMASAAGGQYSLPKVQVLGIDGGFTRVAGGPSALSALSADEAFISRNLAERLNLKEGDECLLRIKKLSLIPLNAPFVSDAELIRPLRVTVAGILEEEEMGRFGLKNIQSAPYNVFLPLGFLNETMAVSGKANHLLISAGEGLNKEETEQALSQSWDMEDINLNLQYNPIQEAWEITSDRVFIEKTIQEALSAAPLPKEFILTYFVNALSLNGRSAPYSFVSTLPREELLPGEMIINEWLAEDLQARPGDTIEMRYFIIGPLRELEERASRFTVKKIVPLEGPWADERLMPHLPGLSDAGNCRDWETGVPVDLEKIRDKDEAYWNRHKGAPKAYISYPAARELWRSRFGESTIIRFAGRDISRGEIEKAVKDDITPLRLGFKVEAVRDNALLAAGNGVDFSQLFLGLSFFLVAAGILLTVLLFLLNTERRMAQIGTLSFLGFTNRQVKIMLLGEGLLVSLAGAALGLLLAVAYNQAVFAALNSIWADIVRTQTLISIFRPATLLTGFALSVLLCFLTIFFYLNRLLKQHPHALQTRTAGSERRWVQAVKNAAMYAGGAAALIIVAWSYAQSEFRNAGLFFAAGGLLLLSFLLLADRLFRKREKANDTFHMTAPRLIRQNIQRNAGRSFLVVALFAIASFLIVTTGANRKDFLSDAEDKSSGAGGFLFYAESAIPVLHNLNEPAARFGAGLEKDYRVVQLMAHEGDDASCLNLNRTASPRILGVEPHALSGRFSFVNKTEGLNMDSPWMSLNEELGENTIPAIADQTVIQWGLGLKTGDTLQYLDENGAVLNLKLIGGLANSIFQGSVLISRGHFLGHFPSSSGSNTFLIDGPSEEKAGIRQELEQSFRDHGWAMQEAAARLAEFNSVENTYLSIFMILGGLGLILGTIGLAIVLARNLLGRRNELGLLQAVGFPKALILRIVVLEHFYLLLAGVGIGLASSLLATLPSWLNPNIEISPWSLVWLMGFTFLHGVFWIVLISWRFLAGGNVIGALRGE